MFCRANFEGFESWTNGFLIRNEGNRHWCKEGGIDKIVLCPDLGSEMRKRRRSRKKMKMKMKMKMKKKNDYAVEREKRSVFLATCR